MAVDSQDDHEQHEAGDDPEERTKSPIIGFNIRNVTVNDRNRRIGSLNLERKRDGSRLRRPNCRKSNNLNFEQTGFSRTPGNHTIRRKRDAIRKRTGIDRICHRNVTNNGRRKIRPLRKRIKF